MLYGEGMQIVSVRIVMTVFHDAVKLEVQDAGRRLIIGWFADEVSALGAAGEHVLMQSAILSTLRKLPELVITCVYQDQWAKRKVLVFKRATRVKHGPHGRSVVRVPGSFGKTWLL